jgi:DNA-binding CsgD family transcriptional regulator
MVSSTLDRAPSSIGEIAPSRLRTAPCFVLLDLNYQIVGAEPRLDGVLREAEFFERPPYRLPAAIEWVVRELVAAAAHRGEAFAEAAFPAYQLFVRSGILVGPSGNYVAVMLETLASHDPLNGAATRFSLSPRERQVLMLVMNGLGKREIAARLTIAESTVGEYFKHLYVKVGVRNRSAMFARIFDWPEAVY